MILKILHIMSALTGGGVESSIMGSYRVLSKSGVIFDFVVFTERVGMLEEEAKSYRSKVYHIPSKHESYMGHLNGIKDILKNSDYDAVHCHLAEKGFWFYFYSKKYDKKSIMHTHGCWNEQSFAETLKKRILARLSLKYCDMCCSCSTASAKYVFGKDYKISNIVNNAFKIERFPFSEDDRVRLRQKFGIADSDFLIGEVGRLSYEKNQGFLIKILYNVLKVRENAKLMLVGDGAMRNEWEQLAAQLGIADKVVFTGNVKDPEKYYSAFDAFVFPSINEGFGMSLVEAQINGLKCVVSAYITDEAIVNTNDVLKIALNDEEKWAKALSTIEMDYDRTVSLENFVQFSAGQVSERLMSLYNKLLN